MNRRARSAWRPGRIGSLFGAAGLVVGLMMVSQPGATAGGGSATGGITFASPYVVNPVHAYGEPLIKIGPDGTTHVSGPWGTGTQRSIWDRSVDGGRTYRTIHKPAIHTASESNTTIPCPDTIVPCPGGGDTEIALDRRGNAVYSDLAALASLKTAAWNEARDTLRTGFIENPEQNINGYDRQWFALWDPANPQEVRAATGYTGPFPVNYLLFAEALAGTSCDSGSCESAAYSSDGTTYSDTTVSYDMENDGPLVIDQQTGAVIEAISTYDGDPQSYEDVGVAIVTRDPGAPDDPALRNVQIVKVADLPAGHNTRLLFPVPALDQARNLYVVWGTRPDVSGTSVSEDPLAWQIFYSYAKAESGWTQWSAPVKVSTAPSNTNVMPWAVAGSSGRLAVVWYGTDDTTHDPSTEDAHQPWDVYLSSVTNADTPTPAIEQVKVTRHPAHYGTICLEGLGCILVQGNRNNADFFQVAVDPRDGAIAITYNDTSNELIQEVPPLPDGTVDHRGAPVVMVARQNGGTGLFGTAVSGDPTEGSSMKDFRGDALFDPVYGTNVDQLDLRGVSVIRSLTELQFTINVRKLENLEQGLSKTGAAAVDYVARWTGPSIEDPDTGTKNPIYYAAVEVLPSGLYSFFAGEAQSVDLCSVSACTPHVLNYPAPPQGGTLVTGELVRSPLTEDYWVIHVPLSVVGNPAPGSRLESLSAFTFARNHSAGLTITTAEAEAGILPIEVDGICCRDAAM